jgi:quercetin dioxygenase-like cupin family protein
MGEYPLGSGRMGGGNVLGRQRYTISRPRATRGGRFPIRRDEQEHAMEIRITLIRETTPVLTELGALAPEGGQCTLDGAPCTRDLPASLPAGNLARGDCTSWLRFALTRGAPETTGEVLTTAMADLPPGPVLLRLDQVSFPPGAVAYRHVHAGPGIRYLDRGALHLQADDHAFDAALGDSWFEDANSPVRATAAVESRFLRFMALPVEYAGKPSIKILSAEDAALPRRQTTHRFLERIVQLDAG